MHIGALRVFCPWHRAGVRGAWPATGVDISHGSSDEGKAVEDAVVRLLGGN